MRKYVFSLVLLVSIISNSCEREKDFDETLLYGRWVEGTLYYRYASNGTGGSWDTSDDVHEEEAQPFTWTLNGSRLLLSHQHFGGGISPEVFTVTELTETTLRVTDEDNRKRVFRKN